MGGFVFQFINMLLRVFRIGGSERGLLPMRNGGNPITGLFFKLRQVCLESLENIATIEIFVSPLEPFRLGDTGCLPRPAAQAGFPNVSRLAKS